MNRSRPTGDWLGWCAIAALKTHALQALARVPSLGNLAKRLECVRFIGAFAPAWIQGGFMVPRRRWWSRCTHSSGWRFPIELAGADVRRLSSVPNSEFRIPN